MIGAPDPGVGVGDDIDGLIDEIVVDAFGEDEQLWSFRQAFRDTARFPFRATVVGADVMVAEVDFECQARRGLTALCQRAGESYSVSLLDIMSRPRPGSQQRTRAIA